MIISLYEMVHHGQSYAYHHIYSAPKDISSVVWMVIMGDGVVIGVTFASGFVGGDSTCV